VDNIKIAAGHTVTLTGNTVINGYGFNDRLTVLGTLNTAGFNLTVDGAISAGTTSGTINTGTGGVVTQNWTGTQQTAITITGSGGFTKLGSGATNFNRAQTYTGTTTIGSGAILGIGFNTTTGSLSSSSIVNDGTLRLNRSNDFTLSADISGTGDVVKMRSSTVTLSGNNTYQGKTYIGASISTVAGTLVIANTSSLPSATDVIFHSSTAGKLQLNADASCNKLFYGATAQASGTYGSTSSSASNQDNTYFSGTKVLTVSNSLVNNSPVERASSELGSAQELPNNFDVKVLGNPSTSMFILKIESNNFDEKVTLKIVDISGRIVEVKQNLYAGAMVELGMDYKAGSYFVEAIQGEQRKVIKLFKR
jgi:fibronectin-binding autotransporter adhesin